MHAAMKCSHISATYEAGLSASYSHENHTTTDHCTQTITLHSRQPILFSYRLAASFSLCNVSCFADVLVSLIKCVAHENDDVGLSTFLCTQVGAYYHLYAVQ